MITLDDARTLTGGTAYGPDGDKVGTVGQIYLDNDTGQPGWATVSTGLFGTKESFVPLSDATTSEGGLRLAYDKDRIKGAPQVDADRELSPAEEDELYAYYGISSSSGTTSRTDDDLVETGTTYTGAGSGDSTYSGAGCDAGTTTTGGIGAGAAGVASMGRDEGHIEGHDTSGPDLSEEEHEIVLTEERPVVTTQAVPVERVRLTKDEVEDTGTVGVDVREERIETDADSGTTRR